MTTRSLFTLEDDFVTSLCFGASDADTKRLFADALEDGRKEIQREVRERSKRSEILDDRHDEVDVALIGDHFVVLLPDDVADDALAAEYGSADEPPRPLLRQGVVQARQAAAKAITAGLEMR